MGRSHPPLLARLGLVAVLAATALVALASPGRAGLTPAPTFDGNLRFHAVGGVAPALGGEGNPVTTATLADLFPGTLDGSPWFASGMASGVLSCDVAALGTTILFDELTTAAPCGSAFELDGFNTLGDYLVIDAYVRVPVGTGTIDLRWGPGTRFNELHLLAGAPGALTDRGGGYSAGGGFPFTGSIALSGAGAVVLPTSCDLTSVLAVRLYLHDGSQRSVAQLEWSLDSGAFVPIPAADVSTPAGYIDCELEEEEEEEDRDGRDRDRAEDAPVPVAVPAGSGPSPRTAVLTVALGAASVLLRALLGRRRAVPLSAAGVR